MTPGLPTDTIYAKNLPITWREADLAALFGPFGAVVDCRLLPVKGVAPGSSALIRMVSTDDAARAIKQLHGMVPVGASLPLIVRFADSPQEKAQKQLRSQVADSRYAMLDPTMTVPFHGRALVPTWVRQMPAPHLRTASGAIPTRVIVSCLPRGTDPLILYQLFSPLGAVVQMRVDEDPSGQSCTAQLLMGSHAEASVALSLDGTRIGDATIRVALAVGEGMPMHGGAGSSSNLADSPSRSRSSNSSMTTAYSQLDPHAAGDMPSLYQQLLPHLYSSATQLAPTGMASDPGEGQQGPGGFQSPAFQDLVNAISGLNFMHNRPHSDGN